MSGVRVLIIDDVESEVLELVRILWRIGVAPLYVDPAHLEGDEPIKPLSGIRLAFLDMDIIGAGADSKSKVAALANCLRRVIDKENGPYVAVAWTNHPELVKDLDDYIFPLKEIARPSAFVTIGKEESKDIPALSTRINTELQNRGPVRMLKAWEDASIQAAGEVVGELAAIASGKEDDPTKWREAWNQTMLRIMHSCGKEFVGEGSMKDGSTAYRAFCHSLIPLHGDKLESQVFAPNPDLVGITKDLLNDSSKVDCGVDAKARINSMLHCSFDDPATPQAGSVYLLQSLNIGSLFPEPAMMLKPLVSIGNLSPEDYKKRAEELAAKVIPIVVETSPACDHVQQNLIVARLTGGHLVPLDVPKGSFKSTLPQSIWRLAPLWLSVGGGSAMAYGLLVNCLLVGSCALDVLKGERAIFRIRGQAFSTLQACFASHAARPGMLLLK